MPRILALGLIVLALALLVPTAVFAYTGGGASDANVRAVTHPQAEDGDHEARPWIGLSLVPLNERLAEHLEIDQEEGIVVVRVHPESPAAEAGFERGDIVLTLGGEEVDEVSDVAEAVHEAAIGDMLDFGVLRGADELALSVAVGERPILQRDRPEGHRPPHAQAKPSLGMAIAPLNENLAERLGLDAEEGIVVLNVRPESPADTAGFQQGDIILAVGDTEVEKVSDIVQSIRDAEPGDTLTFTVARQGEADPVSIDVIVGEHPAPDGDGSGIPFLNLIRPLASHVLEGELIFNDREGNQVTLAIVSGAISEVGEGSLVIDPAAEGSDNFTVTVGEDTVIVKNGHKVGPGDLAVDDEVVVVLKDGTLTAVLVKPIFGDRPRLGPLPQAGDAGDQSATRPRLFRRGGPQFQAPGLRGFQFRGPQLRGELPEAFRNFEERFGQLQERLERLRSEAQERLQDIAPRIQDRGESNTPAPSQAQPTPDGGSTSI